VMSADVVNVAGPLRTYHTSLVAEGHPIQGDKVEATIAMLSSFEQPTNLAVQNGAITECTGCVSKYYVRSSGICLGQTTQSISA
jgi:hypothetical protein